MLSRRHLVHTSLASLLVAPPALAAEIRTGRRNTSFDYAWTNANGESRTLSFELPTAAVEADSRTPKRISLRNVQGDVVDTINAQPRSRFGAAVTAELHESGGIALQVKAPDDATAKAALAAAQQFRDRQLDLALAARGYVRLPSGAVMPDHVRLIREYAPQVGPIVKGLGGRGKKPRAFARKVLSWVQSIPYEKRATIKDRYRRPFNLLAKDKGDCDSKLVLFLAVMQRAWPKVDAAVVYVEGHAFGALDLPATQADHLVPVGKRQLVGVEPVGPAQALPGQLSEASINGLRTSFRVRPVV